VSGLWGLLLSLFGNNWLFDGERSRNWDEL
jgi:hypothetical protein